MGKIELGTPEGTTENIDKIAELFPQVMTEVENDEGTLERAIDFDALRDLLGDVAEDQRERYQFTWPGKREAKAEARRPVYKTMIPEPDKSKDWDTTENLYIEGDNLDALKILKETYAGKVKLIYIDPHTTQATTSSTMTTLPRRAASMTPRAENMTRWVVAWSPTPRAMVVSTRTGARWSIRGCLLRAIS